MVSLPIPLPLSPPLLLLLFPLDSRPAALRELVEAGQRLGAGGLRLGAGGLRAMGLLFMPALSYSFPLGSFNSIGRAAVAGGGPA